MPFLSSEIIRDVIGSRPSASSAGRLFFASDTGITSRDNGSSWDNVGLGKYTTSWSAQTSVTVTHSLGTTAVIVQVYDAGGVLVIPESVTATSTSVVTLTFGAAFTGSVVVLG